MPTTGVVVLFLLNQTQVLFEEFTRGLVAEIFELKNTDNLQNELALSRLEFKGAWI